MNEDIKNQESPFSRENLEKIANKPPNWLTITLAITRWFLLTASPFIAYWIDKPNSFWGWAACLILWGILVWVINNAIGVISALLIKYF